MTTAPSRTSVDPEIEEINRQIKLLRAGQIAYRVPSPMRVNDLQRVTVRVGYALSASVVSELPGSGPVASSQVTVGPHVRAELSGPDFTITRVGGGDGRRVLADNNFAEWAWDVRPQRSGTLHLDLVLYVLVGEGDSSLYTRTFEKTVEVKVNTVFSLGRWLKDYWAPTGLTVPVLGAGLYALVRRVRARRAKVESKTTKPPVPPAAREKSGAADPPSRPA